MSTLNDIFKKIEDKTELASHEVQLGLVDDFAKMSDNYFQQSSKFETKVQKIESSIKEMQDEFIVLQKTASTIDNEYQKLRKLSIDLGVQVPVNAENDYKKVLAILKNDFATFKKYNK